LLFVFAFLAALAAAAAHGRLGHLEGRARWAAHAAAPLLLAASMLLSPADVVDKLLSRLIMPVGLLWLLAFALAYWSALRGRFKAALMPFGAWILMSIAGSTWVGVAMIRWLERGYVMPPLEARFDVVMVLGGGTDVTPEGAPQLSHAGDRLRVGALLYAHKQAERLVCSGSGAAGIDQVEARDLAREAATLLGDMGVPRAAIIELPGPINTQQEIAALAAFAKERGFHRVGLVTSAWHLRRAMRLADRFGLDATPIPADARGHQGPANIMGVVPSGSGFYVVQIAWKEIIGALVGR